ncbi:MAG TPA: PKD domain-containing protein [Vicinamibacterales bacterium]
MRTAIILVALTVCCAWHPGVARAQSPTLQWDEDPSSTVTGFAISVDGVRTEYGITPRKSDGTCSCSIPLPFATGMHTITVIAENTQGEVSSAPLVNGPTARTTGPYSAQVGAILTVSGASSTDVGGTITNYTWNWGDGSTVTQSVSPSGTHAYAAAGNFTITLTVTDSFHITSSVTTTATLTGSAPSTPTSPNPPSGATGVNGSPTLTWSASGATSYDVQFGATNPPPTATSGVTTAAYSPAVSAGTTYFWRVVARSSSGATTGPVWSFTTAVASTLPGWTTEDIGAVGRAGSATLANGVFTVQGAGGDVWGTQDAFRFVQQTVAGNAELVTRVTHIGNTNGFAKAGVMVRDQLTATSRHVLLDVRPTGDVELMTRESDGGDTAFIAGTTVQLPVWLKITRSQDNFSGFVSSNGTTWTSVGSVVLSLPPSLNDGIIVSSHDATTLNTSTFDNLSVATTVNGLPSPWTAQSVGSVGLLGTGTYSNGTFTMSGSGADIWGTSDAFEYVNQSASTDVQIVARVATIQSTNAFAKAGVMMRSGTGSSDAHVVLDTRPDGSLEFMTRASFGSATTFVAGGYQLTPVWLKLVRSGNQVTGSVSTDGTSWQVVGTTPASFSAAGAPYTVGLAVTSHDQSQLNTSMFDHVSVTAGAAGGGTNLLTNPGFESSVVPGLGPGWVSDASRQTAAHTEMTEPHSGSRDAACRTTSALDCGMYQDMIIAATGNYVFTLYATTDKAGALIGVNVNGAGQSVPVQVGGYQAYSVSFSAHAGDSVRVWAYSPASAGSVVIDDASVLSR